MKKKLIFSILFFFFILGFVSPVFSQSNFAGDVGKQLKAAGGAAGLGNPVDPRAGAAQIIRYALSTLGIIFLILIIYAGFTWMTAGGNEERSGKAKKLMFDAVIGLIIIVTAYSITLFAVRIAWQSKSPPARPGGVYIEPPSARGACPYGDVICNSL